MRGARVILAVALVGIVLVDGAHADHIVVRDGAAERGPLDVQRVQHFGGSSPTWRITTYSGWSRKAIWDQGFLTVYLDTFGSDRHDYYALIRADRARVRATLFRDRQVRSDYAIRKLKLRRWSKDSANVTVPLSTLRIADDSVTYNWYVQTSWAGRKCPRVCFDWAPDSGENGDGVEEPLPLDD